MVDFFPAASDFDALDVSVPGRTLGGASIVGLSELCNALTVPPAKPLRVPNIDWVGLLVCCSVDETGCVGDGAGEIGEEFVNGWSKGAEAGVTSNNPLTFEAGAQFAIPSLQTRASCVSLPEMASDLSSADETGPYL